MAGASGEFDWGPVRTAYLRADSEHCRRLLEAAPAPRALIWLGCLDVREARYASAITTLLRVRAGEPQQRAERDVWLARCYANTGEYAMAHGLVERASTVVRPPNRTAYRAIYARALTFFLARQFEEAELAIDPLVNCDDAEYRAQAQALRGWVAARREDVRGQIDCLNACFDTYEGVEEPLQYVFAPALVAFASLCREMPIAHLHERVRRSFARVPRTNGIAGAYFQLTRILGWIDALQGNDLSAMRYWRDAEESAPSEFWRVFCLVDRAYLARVSGRLQFAEDSLQAAHEQASQLNWNSTRDEERLILLTIAQLFAAEQPALAERYLALFRSMPTELDPRIGWLSDRRTRALQLYPQSIALLQLGEREAAIAMLEEAWSIFSAFEYGWRAALAALDLYKATGEARWLQEARRQIEPWPRSWIARDAALAG
jgi:tetratricopeptide (TPR) repeat protein